MIKKRILNKRRKESMTAFFYKLAELLIAGIGLAGILNGKTPMATISIGFVLAIVAYAIAFYLEGDDEE